MSIFRIINLHVFKIWLTLNMIHFHFVTLLYFTGHGAPGRRNVIPNSQFDFPKEKFEELSTFSV